MTQALRTTNSSPHRLRAELEAMVLGDLLGPAEGQEEELTERTVRDRYLVGVLAPSRSGPTAAKPSAEDDEDEDTPLIPDELSEGGSDTADDGTTDADIPVAQAFLPSSFGLTFCVDDTESSIRVTATWGQYKREKRDDREDHRGNPLRVWKRYPRGGVVEVPLKDGPMRPTAPDPLFPDILVQGQVRKRDSHFAVTLFLVNAQEEGRPKDESHVFQPKLVVTGVGDRAVFCKRGTVGPNDDLEERLTAMLYRHHVEYAVGHGVSVHAEAPEGSSCGASRIETILVPRHEVPRTTPPTEADADENPAFGKLAGLVLDMKTLAEATPKTLPPMLAPLVVAYRDWIDREEVRLADPPRASPPSAMRAGSPSTTAASPSSGSRRAWGCWPTTRRRSSRSPS